MAEWIKLWRTSAVTDATMQGIWANLLLLAARSDQQVPYGTAAVTTEIGYPDATLAQLLGCSERTWYRYKALLTAKKQITVSKGNVIHITNWRKYQSEALRKMDTRKTEQAADKIPSLERERDKEREKEKSAAVGRLFTHFRQQYALFVGRAYVPSFGRDKKLIAGWLDFLTEADVRQRMNYFFASEKAFFRERAWTVLTMAAEINNLAEGPLKDKERVPFAKASAGEGVLNVGASGIAQGKFGDNGEEETLLRLRDGYE